MVREPFSESILELAEPFCQTQMYLCPYAGSMRI